MIMLLRPNRRKAWWLRRMTKLYQKTLTSAFATADLPTSAVERRKHIYRYARTAGLPAEYARALARQALTGDRGLGLGIGAGAWHLAFRNGKRVMRIATEHYGRYLWLPIVDFSDGAVSLIGDIRLIHFGSSWMIAPW